MPIKNVKRLLGYKKEEFCAPDFDFLNLITPEYQNVINKNFEKTY